MKHLAQRTVTLFALAMILPACFSEVRGTASAALQNKIRLDLSWKPPNSEAPITFVSPNDPCPSADVVAKAGQRAAEIVDNLEKFDAVETTKRAVLDNNGFSQETNTSNFDYMVEFVRTTDTFKIRESRTPLGNSNSESLHDSGLAALVILLHPSHQHDFEFRCEGKATWQDHTAWVIHFSQLEDKPPTILSLRTDRSVFLIPLKGRAWVRSDDYQTVHIETNLAHHVEGLPLAVNAIFADYAPVHFTSTNSDLWLPQMVETYVQLGKQRTVTAHVYSDFKLFSVGSSFVAGKPKGLKETSPPENEATSPEVKPQ